MPALNPKKQDNLNLLFGRIINKEFRITFQPKNPDAYGKRRFSVGALSLKKYIGYKNAVTCIALAIEDGEDKFRKKLRKYGIIDIYSK